MPRSRSACMWLAVLFVSLRYCAFRVAGQCVMEDLVGFTGSDLGSSVISGISTFEDCKTDCLQKDACIAAELRITFCLQWTGDPQQSASAGMTIALKNCPDVTTSSTIDLQPSETSPPMQMTSSTVSVSSTSSIAPDFCAHGVTQIAGDIDYLTLDGGPVFADNIFTADGWETTTPSGDTFTITFTGDGEKSIQQLSFVIKNGQDSDVNIVIETSPGNFNVQDVINATSDEQSYANNFNTRFVSIAITTTATISSLRLKLCNEDSGDGGATSTPVIQTPVETQDIGTTMTSVMSSPADNLKSSEVVSPSEKATVPGDVSTSSTPVMQTSVEIRATETSMTSSISSASENSISSDLISPTQTATVSGLESSALTTMSTQSATSVIGLITPGSVTFVFHLPTPSFTSTSISGNVQSTSSPEATTPVEELVHPGSVTFVLNLPTPNLTTASTQALVLNSLSSQPANTLEQVIQPTITRVSGSNDMPNQDIEPSSASLEPSTVVIALSATGAFIVCAFIVVLVIVILMARRSQRNSAPEVNESPYSSSTPNGMVQDTEKTIPSNVVYPGYKTHFIPPKEPQHLYHIPRPMFNV